MTIRIPTPVPILHHSVLLFFLVGDIWLFYRFVSDNFVGFGFTPFGLSLVS